MPVLSTSRFSGPSARRYRIWTAQRLLPSAQRRVIRDRPVQVRQLQKAGNHPGRLPERQLEKNLDRQTKLDCRIGEHRWSAGAAVMRCEPGHRLVQPDQQRTAFAQRRRVAGPVPGAVAGG